MISTRELVYSLYAAWRLARVDASAVQYFESSPGGFWRSFTAAAIVLPLFALQVALIASGRMEGTDALRVVLALGVFYAVVWLYWPTLMSFVVEVMGVPERFILYVVAHNWGKALTVTLTFIVFVLSEALLSSQLGGILMLVAIGVVLAYNGFIAAATLGCSFLTAAGLAIGEFLLNKILAGVFFDLAFEPAAQTAL